MLFAIFFFKFHIGLHRKHYCFTLNLSVKLGLQHKQGRNIYTYESI